MTTGRPRSCGAIKGRSGWSDCDVTVWNPGGVLFFFLDFDGQTVHTGVTALGLLTGQCVLFSSACPSDFRLGSVYYLVRLVLFS